MSAVLLWAWMPHRISQEARRKWDGTVGHTPASTHSPPAPATLLLLGLACSWCCAACGRNHFRCSLNESLIHSIGNVLVSTGLSSLGYVYVNLDDCWLLPTRDADKQQQADPSKFPSGIAALTAHLHAQGLSFGLYSDAGSKTCQGKAGSLGFESIDAHSYAQWYTAHSLQHRHHALSPHTQTFFLPLSTHIRRLIEGCCVYVCVHFLSLLPGVCQECGLSQGVFTDSSHGMGAGVCMSVLDADGCVRTCVRVCLWFCVSMMTAPTRGFLTFLDIPS